MASYRKKDLKYYCNVIGLSAHGIDPEDLQDEHVTESECVEVWGPRMPSGGFQFNETHVNVHLNQRIKELWSAIYRSEVDEFGLSFAKAILAERKEIPINWAISAMRADGKRIRGIPRNRKERTMSSIISDVNFDMPRKKNKASMQMEKEEVRDDSSMSLSKNQMNNNRDKGKMSVMTPKASQVQVENVIDVNEEQMEAAHNYPRLDQELHGPTSSMSMQYKTNIGKEDEVKRPFTRSKAQQVVNEAQKVREAKKHHAELIANHLGLDEKFHGLATSMSAYESLLHCTLGSKVNLEENIDYALSTRMRCKVAIAAYEDLCFQRDTIDEAIIDSTRRLSDIVTDVKTNKKVGGATGNKDSMLFSIELEDATLWHDSLLEDKMAISYKIEAEMEDVEWRKYELNAANEQLLGLLLEYYKMFGKECNVLDSMQRQLELLQNSFYALKTHCDSGGVGRY